MSIPHRSPEGLRDSVACFDSLYQRCYRQLYAYFLGRLGNPEAAADLLQELAIRVWQRIDAVGELPDDQQQRWLYSIARNLVIDHYRRSQMRNRYEMPMPDIEPPSGMATDPVTIVTSRESMVVADRAIMALPGPLRLVLVLRLLGDMTSAEIGKLLDRPAGTIRYQLKTARGLIAQALKIAETDETVDGKMGEHHG